MHAENSIIDEGGNRKAVEAVDEEFPQFDVVPSFTYLKRGIHSS